MRAQNSSVPDGVQAGVPSSAGVRAPGRQPDLAARRFLESQTPEFSRVQDQVHLIGVLGEN